MINLTYKSQRFLSEDTNSTASVSCVALSNSNSVDYTGPVNCANKNTIYIKDCTNTFVMKFKDDETTINVIINLKHALEKVIEQVSTHAALNQVVKEYSFLITGHKCHFIRTTTSSEFTTVDFMATTKTKDGQFTKSLVTLHTDGIVGRDAIDCKLHILSKIRLLLNELIEFEHFLAREILKATFVQVNSDNDKYSMSYG